MFPLLLWTLVFGFCSLSATEISSSCDTLLECCSSECLDLKSELIGVSHTEGKGLGYRQGYSSLDLFLSQPFCQKRCVPFLDLRGHIFNNGKYAANAGLGFRWLNKCSNQAWGINGFYDYLETRRRPYRQVSLGLEALSETWGVSVNGYLPIGRKETPLYEFSYLNISPTRFLVKGREQLAMKGIDAEVGYRFCNVYCFNFSTAAGPYYYWGRSAETKNAFRAAHKHAIGGRVNASASYRNYITLEGLGTYDSRFKWGGQVTLAVTIPFDFTFNTGEGGAACCLQERLYQPVRRNEIIVVSRIRRYSTNPNILNPEFEP